MFAKLETDNLLLPCLLMTPFKLSVIIQAELLNVLPALVKVLKRSETFPLPVGQTPGQSNDCPANTKGRVRQHFHPT